MLLAQSEDPAVRDVDEALRIAEAQCRETRGKDRRSLESLAAAQWADGDGAAALRSLNQALLCSGNAASRQRIAKLRGEIAATVGPVAQGRKSRNVKEL